MDNQNNQNIPNPQQGYVPPQQGYVPPQQGYVPPQQGYVPPQQGYVPPQQGYVPPQQGYVPPQQGYVPPQQGYVPPQQGYVPPQQSYVSPQELAYQKALEEDKKKHEKEQKKIGMIVSIVVLLLFGIGIFLFSKAGIFDSKSTTLSGTYVSTDGYTTFEFKGNTFTQTTLGIEIEGTYKIKGDEIILTFDLFGEEYEDSLDFEKSRDYIKIDDTKFEKE